MNEINLRKSFGVYQIRNLIDGKIYVGSTYQSFYLRWYSWRRELNLGRGSIHLSRAWKREGEQNFKFEILELLSDKNQVRNREQFWIDTLHPEYNIRKDCKSSLRAVTKEETKQKMSLIMKEKLKDPELKETYRKNALKALEKVDRYQPRPNVRGQRIFRLCPVCDSPVKKTGRKYCKTCGSKDCIAILANCCGGRSWRKDKRSERPCPVCGQQRKECYTSNGKFSKYQKTCGRLQCISALKGWPKGVQRK